ncbi:MAG TPA: hypothetical protein VLI90_17415 [Tepidisphaeraceae bacterium]|nr:hypothetical protein [Tepidisphaeraceae bacterium]
MQLDLWWLLKLVVVTIALAIALDRALERRRRQRDRRSDSLRHAHLVEHFEQPGKRRTS